MEPSGPDPAALQNSQARYITRGEYVALVTSHRPLLRKVTGPRTARVHELLDRDTHERFLIREDDLHQSASGIRA